MDAIKETLGRRCKIEEPETLPESENSFELLPCPYQIKLKPEDEISVESIISAIIPRVENSEAEFQDLKWDLVAKDFYNEKQSMLFKDLLYISQLRDDCKLSEETKIFLENELDEVGEFHLCVEESYDGYVVFSKSHMSAGSNKYASGHSVRAKYDDKMHLICERRGEFDHVDNARIERTLDARIIDDQLIAKRECKINNEIQRFKAVINMKGRDAAFLLDGGILLLMRYLIINNFRGDFHYFTMNLFGKVLRCKLTVNTERKQIKMFHRSIPNAIHVVNVQYFNDYPVEVSETFYTSDGKIVLHYWHGFRYILHATKGLIESQDLKAPRMELMWRSQNQLLERYKTKKKLTFESTMHYFASHPELTDFLNDFVLTVLKHKPQHILEFAVLYFQKFRKPPPPS